MSLFIYFINAAKSQNNKWVIYHPSNSGMKANYITYIYIDPFQEMILATGYEGLFEVWTSIFEKNNWNSLEDYCSDTTAITNLLISRSIISMYDSSLLFIMQFSDNLFSFKNSKLNIKYPTIDSTFTIASGYPNSILRFDSTNLWIVSVHGIYLYNISTNEILPFSNNELPIPADWTSPAGNQANIDNYNNVWISPNSRGIGKLGYDSTWQEFNTQNSGLSDNKVWTGVFMDKNHWYWVGTANGLNKFKDSTWVNYFTFNSDLPDNYINDIVIDSNNVKWICTNNGFAKFNDTTWTIYNTSNSGLPDNQVNCIAIYKYNNKWIGTSNGLAVFNETGVITSVPEIKQPQQFSPSANLSVSYSPEQKKIKIYFSTGRINKTISVELTDIQGRSIATIPLLTLENSSQYDATKLKPGVHLVRVKSGAGADVQRVVVY